MNVDPAAGRHSGVSLVEILIALAIGAVLSFGVTQLFVRSKISYLQDEELARIGENGRYALRYLRRELAMSGYLGGALASTVTNTVSPGSPCFDYLLDVNRPLEHFDNVSAAGSVSVVVPDAAAGQALPMDCLVPGRHRPGTDMLLVRRTFDTATVLQGRSGLPRDSRRLYLRVESWGADVSLVRGGGPLAATVDLWQYSPQLLFVRNYSVVPDDGIPTLCRMRVSPASARMAPVECLVEGVENLQLEFGVDDDGDHRPDRFASQPTASLLQRAVVARLYLLMRSIRPIAGLINDNEYWLGSTRVAAAGDHYYRRVVQTTALLRNLPAYRL